MFLYLFLPSPTSKICKIIASFEKRNCCTYNYSERKKWQFRLKSWAKAKQTEPSLKLWSAELLEVKKHVTFLTPSTCALRLWVSWAHVWKQRAHYASPCVLCTLRSQLWTGKFSIALPQTPRDLVEILTVFEQAYLYIDPNIWTRLLQVSLKFWLNANCITVLWFFLPY